MMEEEGARRELEREVGTEPAAQAQAADEPQPRSL